ncbi:UDP-glycosyltransferase 85A2 [Acorus gramineus]|uniref:Glycosyltransferase n=1 Tax=Acorus gramineus TaxID=55184 RepID=A0AAV9AG10_ACOGR|nr:UDP-glycosyltransferase 85A2 [Acorus gramineus]
MGSIAVPKSHIVCIPFPAQGHINPMLKLAKLLHFKGFYITFVNTEFNHKRLLRSRGPKALDGAERFRFDTIPDGLPPIDQDVTQSIPALCDSTTKNMEGPFRDLLNKLNDDVTSGFPPVTHILSDGVMSFTLDVAEEMNLPDVLFWTPSACGLLGYMTYRRLIEQGVTPFKDEKSLGDGTLDTQIEFIPGVKNMRLRDFPSFLRTTDPNDIMLNYCTRESQRASRGSAVILNTYEELERDVLDAIRLVLPRVYTLGSLSMLCQEILGNQYLSSLQSNLWKEDPGCLDWLKDKEPNSVVYVNFGSITVMTDQQLIEFAWGLANSKKPFLWIIRPDLINGDSAVLPEEFLSEIKERGMLASWCPQEQVLSHPSIGGFLTHSGWNSTLESICVGVPMLCWPFFAEQTTNCHYSCVEWGIGMEIDNDVKREGVEKLIRELMEGEEGNAMKDKSFEWMMKARIATKKGGSSFANLDKLIDEVLIQK